MSTKEDLEKIVEFLISERGEYRFELNEKTSLQSDLGIYGDDAYDIILKFSITFCVDVSDLHLDSYFHSEGFGRSINVNCKEFTIKNLVDSLQSGKLK